MKSRKHGASNSMPVIDGRAGWGDGRPAMIGFDDTTWGTLVSDTFSRETCDIIKMPVSATTSIGKERVPVKGSCLLRVQAGGKNMTDTSLVVPDEALRARGVDAIIGQSTMEMFNIEITGHGKDRHVDFRGFPAAARKVSVIG